MANELNEFNIALFYFIGKYQHIISKNNRVIFKVQKKYKPFQCDHFLFRTILKK